MFKFIFILLLNLLVINIVLFLNFYSFNSIYTNHMKNTIQKTILEFQELDPDHLCTVLDCREFSLKDVGVYHNIDGLLVKSSDDYQHKYLINNSDIKLTTELFLRVDLLEYELYIISDSRKVLSNILDGYFNINILVLILYIIAYGIIEYKTNRRKIVDLATTSDMLREKNMQILTENIHHELNTPITIIQGNIKKLEISMNKEILSCSECLNKYYFDFEQIYSAIEQIDTVLQRMSNFKNLKYSNGNKNLMNIIEYSSNSMDVYKNPNFKIVLDEKLKDFGLRGPLLNGDLLSISSNHFRNSIEAKATKIIVEVKMDYTKNIMHLYIIDNGTGLRDRDTGLILQKDKYNDIFKPYYSSKRSDGTFRKNESKSLIHEYLIKLKFLFIKQDLNKNARGVGLYLNKELLTEKGGDLKLRETSTKGTVFEVIFPVKNKNKK